MRGRTTRQLVNGSFTFRLFVFCWWWCIHAAKNWTEQIHFSVIIFSVIKIARAWLCLIIREVFQLLWGDLGRHFEAFWCPDSYVTTLQVWMLSCLLVVAHLSRTKLLFASRCLPVANYHTFIFFFPNFSVVRLDFQLFLRVGLSRLCS